VKYIFKGLSFRRNTRLEEIILVLALAAVVYLLMVRCSFYASPSSCPLGYRINMKDLVSILAAITTALLALFICYLGRLRIEAGRALEAERVLKESEQKYRAVFENASTPIIIIEEDMTITLANTEFEKICGYKREEIEGKKKWTEFFLREDLERMMDYHRLRRIDFNSVPRNYDCRFVDRYGRVRDIYITVAMIPGTKKSVASLLDITERKGGRRTARCPPATDGHH